MVLERRHRRARSGRRDDQLPGRAVRAVRRADPLHALLRARRSVGEAQVGLPDAAAVDLRHPRLQHHDPVLLRAWRRTTTSRSTRCTPRARASCGRASGATARRMAQYSIKAPASIRTPPTCPSSIADRDQYDGWRGSLETKGLFNLGSWWKFGWDVTTETDDEFRRFYKLDNILLTDRVNKIFFNGMSDRNFFQRRGLPVLGPRIPDAPAHRDQAVRLSDHRLQLRLRRSDPRRRADVDDQRAEPLQQSGSDGVRPVCRRQPADEPRGDGAELAPPSHRSDRHHLHAVRAVARRRSIRSATTSIPSTTPRRSRSTSFARGLAAGGVTVAYPWVANTSWRLARHRADRPDHRPPGIDPAGRTCRTRTRRASSSTTRTCSS